MPAKEIITTVTGRITHPILGNYFLALLFLNWKLWLLFFSGSETLNWRISSVEEYLQSQEFKLSFLFAFLILCIYLYLLPFLILLIKSLQNRVELYQLRKEMYFDRRLQNERNLGGNVEVLATGLKNDFSALSEHLKYYDEYVHNNLQVKNPGFQAAYNDLHKKSLELTQNAENHLSHLKDILSSNYGVSAVEMAKRFHEARKQK